MTIGVCLACVGRADSLLVDLGIGLSGRSEEVIDDASILRNRVGIEGQGRRELYPGLTAYLGAEHALCRFKCRGGALARFVVTEHRVEDRGIAQVGTHAHIGDRHEAEPRVLDAAFHRLGHDHLDSVRHLALPRLAAHPTPPSRVCPITWDI